MDRGRWILVARNPFDTIATLSMRRGGANDKLRIEADSPADFAAALAAARGMSVPDRAPDAMIEDYIALCEGTERLCAGVAPEDWLELQYEDFTDEPVAGLTRLLTFARLEPEPGFVAAAVSIVRPPSCGIHRAGGQRREPGRGRLEQGAKGPGPRRHRPVPVPRPGPWGEPE